MEKKTMLKNECRKHVLRNMSVQGTFIFNLNLGHRCLFLLWFAHNKNRYFYSPRYTLYSVSPSEVTRSSSFESDPPKWAKYPYSMGGNKHMLKNSFGYRANVTMWDIGMQGMEE